MFNVLQLYVEYKHLKDNRVFQNWQKRQVMTSSYFLAAKAVQGQGVQFGLASERLLDTICLCNLAGNNYF